VPLHLLSPREVRVARDGDHPDGGGLLLRVRGQRAVWVFRYTSPAGRRRDAGFGIVHRDSMSEAGESLRQARDRAHRARDSLAAGIDFLDQKRSEREAVVKDRAAAKAQREAQHMTLARYARRYHETQIAKTRKADANLCNARSRRFLTLCSPRRRDEADVLDG
jgi:hypothetical protein